MRVVALNAVHFALEYRMMLRQMEFGFRIKMTLETGRRVSAGIYDKNTTATPGLNVFAAGPVAGFAT